jgi:hypothetical protein
MGVFIGLSWAKIRIGIIKNDQIKASGHKVRLQSKK